MIPYYIHETKKEFPKLTKGLKKVADALLRDPSIFASLPAKKIGEKIGVSETMIIRFSLSIGYDSFSSFQKDVRSHLLTADSTEDATAPDEDSSNYIKHLNKDILLLNKNIKSLETQKYEITVDTILNSERIVIAGYYQSYTFAHWMFFNLNYTLGNASLYRPETDALVFDFLPKKSCVIVFSFARYALDTIRLAKDAKKKGIQVIAFTDSRISPIVEFADIVILVEVGNASLFDKGPATLSIINAILSEVLKRADKALSTSDKFKYFMQEE